LKIFLQGEHDLTHGRFCRLAGAQFEDVFPFGQVGIDDKLGFAGVGQHGPGRLRGRGLQQLQVHLFGGNHCLVPYCVFIAAFVKKHGLDKGDLGTEFIVTVPAVALTFLEKGTGPMADDFMGDRPVDDKFDRYMAMPGTFVGW